MTETMYTTGERHPQSTKLFNGRPLTKGNYATRAELEEACARPTQPRVWLQTHQQGSGCE